MKKTKIVEASVDLRDIAVIAKYLTENDSGPLKMATVIRESIKTVASHIRPKTDPNGLFDSIETAQAYLKSIGLIQQSREDRSINLLSKALKNESNILEADVKKAQEEKADEIDRYLKEME